MTDETPKDAYSQFVIDQKDLEETKELILLQNEGSPDEKDSANAELRKRAYNEHPESVRPADPKDLTDKQIQSGLNLRKITRQERSSNNFNKTLDDITSVGVRPVLGNLSRVPEISQRVMQEDISLFEAFGNHQGLEALLRKYESKEALNENERKNIDTMGTYGLADEEVKKFRAYESNSDYSSQVDDAIRAVVIESIDHAKPSERVNYIKPGMKKEIGKAKAKYVALADSGNIYEIIGDALKKFAGESAENKVNAGRVLYKASKAA